MQLTKGQVFDAVTALMSIGQRMKVIPQTAKFRLAKMHEILEPVYIKIRAEENALIQQHGTEQFNEKQESMGWGFPSEGAPSYLAFITAWKVVREEVLEVNIKPITLFSLGDDPKGIEVGEFKMLGPLVVDETP